MAHQRAPVILLIDDDASFVYLIQRYGQMCGCTVVSTPALASALPLIEAVQPALVAVHVSPPTLARLDTLRALKAFSLARARADASASARARADGTQPIPLLAFGAITDAAGAREAGADCWLSKPVMYDDFHAALVALLICS